MLVISLMYNQGNAQQLNSRFLRHLAVQDLEYLREAIKNTHPFPFAYTSEHNFNSLVDREIEALDDTVEYAALRNAARRIVYYVHCVHSTVLTRKITKKEALYLADKYFPVEVKWIGEDFFVYKNYSKDSLIQPGNKLVSINGYSMKTIADSIKTYRSGDGPEVDFIRGIINLPFQFNLLYDLQFPEDSAYRVEYLNNKNELCTTSVLAIYEPQEPSHYKDPVEYAYISKEKNIHLEFLEPNIAMLGINDFDGMQAKHFHYIFRLISEKGSPNLIIDLRSNYGGGMDNANRFISYIVDSVFSFSLRTPVQTKEFDYYDGSGRWQRIAGIMYFMMLDNSTYSIQKGNWCWQSYTEPRKHYNYNGNVYILINEHTLSAASYVASQLKHRAGAILIGSPSGGGEYGNAGYTYTTFTLPNSNSKIKVPHNWINYDIAHTSNHELYPQFTVQPSIDDMLTKRDVVLEKTLEKIRGKSN
jgi:C-terminal processing protease CtpA/Prc